MVDFENFNSINWRSTMADGSADVRKVNCSICGDTGVVFDKNGNTHPCRCWKQKQAHQRFADAKIPKALRSMRFENFDFSYYPANESPDLKVGGAFSYLAYAKKAKQASEQFSAAVIDGSEQNPMGLMLQGQVGSGKTHLAAAIANSLVDANKNVLFLVVPDFLDEIRMSYDNMGEFTEMELMNSAKNAGVLILDDLGAHNFSEWTRNKLFSLINYRINNDLPMVITTNLHLAELQNILGERIISRIISVCKPCLLPVKRDIRLTKLRK